MFKKLEYQKKLKREASYILLYFYKFYFISKKYILYQNDTLKKGLNNYKLKYKQSVINFKNLRQELKKLDNDTDIVEQLVYNYELLKSELKNMSNVQQNLLSTCFTIKNKINEKDRNKKIKTMNKIIKY